MSCKICGASKTVRSHLIPRSFAHEIRADCKDLTILSRGAARPEFSQSGLVDPSLLCSDHEAITGELDRYGVDFVRRARSGRSSSSEGFQVDNPQPHKLLGFAASIVWRAVVSPLGNADRDSLGRSEGAVARAVFAGAPLRAQLYVASISIRHEDNELNTVIMPNRRREAGAWLWMFTVNGCFFCLFLGEPRLKQSARRARADLLSDPVVAYLPKLRATDWTTLTSVIQSIERMPERRR